MSERERAKDQWTLLSQGFTLLSEQRLESVHFVHQMYLVMYETLLHLVFYFVIQTPLPKIGRPPCWELRQRDRHCGFPLQCSA
jgi:hypothetical protein